ncbi:sigma-54-dependent Fis family transcriptional regulator [Bacillus sp. Marseille-Q3570]|uniref:sigma-54 interaction domain-containing protein n=1 Tax=Bacillus sp. Marseille-Q3570 TaxID=2963522 RepID=UPI0021B7D11D|nr:sigma 54-interacting transcriptional regulator [Bacillus sp. Marseille-Q3570]
MSFSIDHNDAEWFKKIIQAVNDGILVIDAYGVVQIINKEYTNITGVTESEIVGKRLRDVRPGAELPEVLLDGKGRAGVFRKEGKNNYIVDMAPIYDGTEIIGAVSVCKSLKEVHHLTQELKKSKQRLRELEEMVGSFHRTTYSFEDVVGQNKGLVDAIHSAKKAAGTDLNILILGESGTGKELFAQAVHQSSSRHSQPFVPVNCAAIPSTLLESELFGYEEGAFTSSKKGGKSGLIDLADNGTLFLDEIGDMPLEMQAKLLRVMQDGVIRKVGSLYERKVNVRVIAATNKNLEKMISKERFRADLYYRVNAFQIEIPSLKSRKDDIPLLVDYFLQNADLRSLSPDESFLDLLMSYDWPGNIRELKNTIHYAMNMTESTQLKVKDLPDTVIRKRQRSDEKTLEQIIEETERVAISDVLEKTGTDLKGKKLAAKMLDISLATLYNKISKLDLPM